jgi:hypothetical protein
MQTDVKAIDLVMRDGGERIALGNAHATLPYLGGLHHHYVRI